MYIIELDDDNIIEYLDFIPADIADFMGRVFVYGILVMQDEIPAAGMIWELKNMMSEEPKESSIIWISVKDDGAARLLFDSYKESISLEDVEKSYFSIPASDSEKEKKCLMENGFSAELSEGDEITASLRQIEDVAVIKKVPDDKAILPLKNATQSAFSYAQKKMAEFGLTGLCDDLVYLPRSYFDNDVSCYYQQGDDSITGLILFHRLPSGGLKLMLMAYLGNDRSRLLSMMKSALKNAMEIYSLDTEIILDRHNYSSLALGEKLFPNEIGKPVYVGSRSEQ